MSTTRWKDNEIKSIDEALKKIAMGVADDTEGNTRWINWKLRTVVNKVDGIKFANKEIAFAALEFNFDQYNYTNDNEERGIPKNGFIIIYQLDQEIYYIINQNTPAQKIIRKLMKYTSRGEISKSMPEFESNFFNWLIYRIYSQKEYIDPESEYLKPLSLDEIRGVRGDSEDSLTKITADGESILNAISALSFFLESSNIDMAKIDVKYGDHNNISLILKNGTISTSIESYNGEYSIEDSSMKNAKLYLLIYLEVLPVLRQEFYNDLDSGTWSEKIRREFLQNLGKLIQDKVQDKINEINED